MISLHLIFLVIFVENTTLMVPSCHPRSKKWVSLVPFEESPASVTHQQTTNNLHASSFRFFTYFHDPQNPPIIWSKISEVSASTSLLGWTSCLLRVVQPLEEMKRHFLPLGMYCFLNDVNVTQLRGFNHCFSFHYVRLLFADDSRIETCILQSNMLWESGKSVVKKAESSWIANWQQLIGSLWTGV